MSELFEGYARHYREISAALSRKCAAASALDGEKKKQKLSEIQAELQVSESLIRKMDLEARSMPPTVKAGLLSKLREYKSDLNNIKSEIKKVSAPNAQQATREELLDSGMSDTPAASSDQRGRLMMTSERLNQSSDRIRESQGTALDTEEIGVSILQNLHNQRQTLLHAHKTELDHGLVQDESFWIPHKHPASLDMSCKRTLMMPNRQKRNPFLPLLHGVDDNIGKSNKILASMSNRNKWWFF